MTSARFGVGQAGAPNRRSPRTYRSWLENPYGPLLTGVIYWLLAYAALEYRVQPANIAIVWPANGFAIGVLLLTHARRWPWLAVCFAAAIYTGNVAQGVASNAAIGFVLANLVEIYSAGIFVRLLHCVSLRSVRSMTLMLGIACFAAPGIGAAVGACVVRNVFGDSLFGTWRFWFVADALGNLVTLPVVLAVGAHLIAPRRQRSRTTSPSTVEGLLLTCTFICGGWWIFSTDSPIQNTGFRSEFMLAPWLLWSALRFPVGSTAAVNACLILEVVASFFFVSGPFATAAGSLTDAVMNGQIYAGSLLTISLIVGAASQTTRIANAMLLEKVRQARDLEQLAEMRARELWSAAGKLKAAQEASDDANRAKSEFLARMSHEIRTPLTAILGFAEMLQERTTAPQDMEDITTIRRSSEHLLTVINEILDHAKIEAGRMEIENRCVDLRALTCNVIELMTIKAAGKGLQLSVSVAHDVPLLVMTDATRLTQVLLNLVGNAVKFTESGAVQLEVQYAAKNDSRSLVIEVRDTGIGMTEDEMSRVFEAYSQANISTTRKHGGTGLGLNISRQIVRLMGGELTVESEIGLGSTFSVELPYQEPPVAALASMRTDTPPTIADVRPAGIGTLQGVRVLVADDGQDNQRFLTRVLEGDSAQVTCAGDGAAAIAAFCAATVDARPFHVILMDAQMPVMDGLTAVRQLRNNGARAPIAALTADASLEMQERAIAAGCDVYLTKPIAKQPLLDVVRRLAFASERDR